MCFVFDFQLKWGPDLSQCGYRGRDVKVALLQINLFPSTFCNFAESEYDFFVAKEHHFLFNKRQNLFRCKIMIKTYYFISWERNFSVEKFQAELLARKKSQKSSGAENFRTKSVNFPHPKYFCKNTSGGFRENAWCGKFVFSAESSSGKMENIISKWTSRFSKGHQLSLKTTFQIIQIFKDNLMMLEIKLDNRAIKFN